LSRYDEKIIDWKMPAEKDEADNKNYLIGAFKFTDNSEEKLLSELNARIVDWRMLSIENTPTHIVGGFKFTNDEKEKLSKHDEELIDWRMKLKNDKRKKFLIAGFKLRKQSNGLAHLT
jgi:hypothetical protein